MRSRPWMPLLIALLTLLSGSNAARAGTPFTITVVDSANDGLGASLVLDTNGDPAIAYRKAGGGIRYAHRSSGVWSIEDVDCCFGNYDPGLSLALDSSNQPHIAYVGGATAVKVAHRSGTGWTLETADPKGNYFLTMVIDPTDRIHLAYRQDLPGGTGKRIRYAVKNGGVWTYETADTGYSGSPHASSFESISLGIDGAGNPIIGYDTGFGNSQFGVARRTGSGWTQEVPDSALYSGYANAIAFGDPATPTIAYENGETGAWLLATRSSGTWQSSTVDPDAGYAYTIAGDVRNSFAYAADGHPVTAYEDYANALLKLATRVANDWVIETVDPTEASGFHNSLALNANGWPRIAYYSNAGLRYAEATGATTAVPTAPANRSFGLSAWPNPARSGQTITARFSLPAADRVAFELYDVSGRRVGSRAAEWRPAGDQQVRLGLDREASGVLFLRLRSESFGSSIRRIAVTR